ncbi:hypothetical protein TrVE_jg7824 [Triparma verrucosa]|uniref:Tyrosine-protein kinase ephrin type A/B receptor-like domain-containing protein n=1 Tax=Triparma verrucosa TaxID=1606542 RepID=A0A9W7EYG2_9STRA|nr:hypothetical protein TrVE_jg7824 [Triparma verrucosa]
MCVAGKFSSFGGWYDCSECTSGTYSLAGAAECTSCEAAKSSSSDFSSREDCAAGEYGDGGPCATCPQGKYSTPASASCTTCQVGRYAGAGQGECTLCGQGKYLNSTGAVAETQCKVCAIGKYNDIPGLGTTCPDCQKGKFAAATGYALCKDCVTGTCASEVGSAECLQCQKGSHSNSTGAATCSKCEEGKFTDYDGTVVCQVCPQHLELSEDEQTCVCLDTFVTKVDGSCTCKAGETLVDGECVPCEDGRYKDRPGTESCTICDTDAIRGAFNTLPGIPKTSFESCACGLGKFREPSDEDNPEKVLDSICKHCSEINLPDGVNCSKPSQLSTS